jgi:hypothetical protein
MPAVGHSADDGDTGRWGKLQRSKRRDRRLATSGLRRSACDEAPMTKRR